MLCLFFQLPGFTDWMITHAESGEMDTIEDNSGNIQEDAKEMEEPEELNETNELDGDGEDSPIKKPATDGGNGLLSSSSADFSDKITAVGIYYDEATAIDPKEVIDLNKAVMVKYEFECTDTTNTIDTGCKYTVQLPECLKGIAKDPAKLMVGAEEYGTVETYGNGLGEIIFNETAKESGQFTGYIWFTGNWDESKLGNGGKQTIQFTNKCLVELTFPAIATDIYLEIEKKGSYRSADKRINWEITLTPSKNPSGRPLADVVVTDILPTGYSLPEGDNVVVSKNNSPMKAGEDYNFAPDHSANSFSIAFLPGKVNTGTSLYKIAFSTEIPDNKFLEEAAKVQSVSGAEPVKAFSVNNKAEVSYKTKEGEADTSKKVDYSVTIPLEELLIKDGKAEGRKIKWTVTANKNGLTIPGATLGDTIPAGLKLDTSQVVLKSGQGPAITLTERAAASADGPYYEYTYTDTKSASQLKVYVGKEHIDKQCTLSYVTDIYEGFYEENKYFEFTNRVELTGTGGLFYWCKKGAGVSSSLLDKSNAGYNPGTQEIIWLITLNKNKNELTEEMVITDEILKHSPSSSSNPGGEALHALVEGSIEIKEGDEAFKKLSKAGDAPIYYEFTENAGDPDKTGTMKIHFKKENRGNKVYQIRYKTKVQEKKIWANNSSATFYNYAKLEMNGIDRGEKTAAQKVEIQIFAKEPGEYDFTSRTVEWKLLVNRDKVPLNRDSKAPITIKDKIGDNQTFLLAQSGLSVYKGKNTTASKDRIPESEYGTIFSEWPTADAAAGETITFKMKPEVFEQGKAEAYTIIFKTKIDDVLFKQNTANTKMTNTASMSGGDVGTGSISVTANKTTPTVILDKKAIYGDEEKQGNVISWTILVNKNCLKLTMPVLKDQLQEHLSLDPGSVRLFEVTQFNGDSPVKDESKEVALTADNIEYNKAAREFKFKFLKDIDKTYLLVFTTDISKDIPANTSISNSISLGASETSVSTDSNLLKNVRYVQGGGVNSLRGTIQIVKRDSKDSNILLSGAEFTLYDRFDNEIGNGISDSHGILKFEDLKTYQNYVLKETKVPDGYTVGIDHTFRFEVETIGGVKTKVIKLVGDSGADSFLVDTNNKEMVYILNSKKASGGGGGSSGGGSGGDSSQPGESPRPSTSPKPGEGPKPEENPKPSPSPKPEETKKPSKEESDKKADGPIKEDTPKNTKKTGQVELEEGDIPRAAVEPEHGTLIVYEDGKWIYTPDKGYAGTDQFIIAIDKDDGTTKEVEVDIDVGEIPKGPYIPEDTQEASQAEKAAKETLPKTGTAPAFAWILPGLCMMFFGGWLLRYRQKEKKSKM